MRETENSNPRRYPVPAKMQRLVAPPKELDPHGIAIPVKCGTGWFDIVAAGVGGDSSLLPFVVENTCHLVQPDDELTIATSEWHLAEAAYAVAAPGGAFVPAPTPDGGVVFPGLVQPVFFRGAAEELPTVTVERDGGVVRFIVGPGSGATSGLLRYHLVRSASAWLPAGMASFGGNVCATRLLMPRRSAGAPPYTLRLLRPPDNGSPWEPEEPDQDHQDLSPSADEDTLVELGRGPWLPVAHVGAVAPPRLLVWRDVCTNTINFVADEGGCVRRDTRPWLMQALYTDARVSVPRWRGTWPRQAALLPAARLDAWHDLHFVALYATEPPWLRVRLRLWLDKHPGCVAHVWGAASWVRGDTARQWDGFADGVLDRVRVHPITEIEALLDTTLRELGSTGKTAGDSLREQADPITLSDTVRLLALYVFGGCYADANDSFVLDDLRYIDVPHGRVAVPTETCQAANNALIIAPRPRTEDVGAWLRHQVAHGGQEPDYASRLWSVLLLPPPVALDQTDSGFSDATELAVVRSLEHGFGPLTLWAHHGGRYRGGVEYGTVCTFRCGPTGCAAWWNPRSTAFQPGHRRAFPNAVTDPRPTHNAILREAGVDAFRYPTGEVEPDTAPAYAAASRWRRWVPVPPTRRALWDDQGRPARDADGKRRKE